MKQTLDLNLDLKFMGKKRAERGSVQVGNNNGSLRLLWTYQGQKFTLNLGLRAGHPYHEKLARDRALRMSRLLSHGDFRPDRMPEYKIMFHGENAPLELEPEIKPISLLNLWGQYQVVVRPGKAPGTLRGYDTTTRHIQRLPEDDLRQSSIILDAITKLPSDTQKRLLTDLSACCKWAVRAGLIEQNPFYGLASQVRIPKRGNTGHDIHPFTVEERDRIIQAFYENRYYRHYAPLVTFQFLTGARPSEGTALKWKGVKSNHILFTESRVYDGHRFVTKLGLKTQDYRRFPIYPQLRALLDGLAAGASSDLVFPSPHGGYINWDNFTDRAWHNVLGTLPEIEYRCPYKMRHTFISLCIEQGIPVTHIAKAVGNSTDVILQRYAKATQEIQIPEIGSPFPKQLRDQL